MFKWQSYVLLRYKSPGFGLWFLAICRSGALSAPWFYVLAVVHSVETLPNFVKSLMDSPMSTRFSIVHFLKYVDNYSSKKYQLIPYLFSTLPYSLWQALFDQIESHSDQSALNLRTLLEISCHVGIGFVSSTAMVLCSCFLIYSS